MHGTKGYLNQLINQIDNQMTFNSMLKPENFKSQQFYSYSYKNSNNFKLENFDIDQLLHPFTKKILNLKDQKIFNSFFGNEKDYLNVVCAYRLYFEKRLYHSMQYSRKRNSNSYTVSIEIDGKELNGQIDYFFKYNRQEFCFINIFRNNIKANKFFSKDSNFFCKTVIENFDFFYAVYKLVDLEISRRIISIKQIKTKCIEVNTDEYKFISKFPYEFEHD